MVKSAMGAESEEHGSISGVSALGPSPEVATLLPVPATAATDDVRSAGGQLRGLAHASAVVGLCGRSTTAAVAEVVAAAENCGHKLFGERRSLSASAADASGEK